MEQRRHDESDGHASPILERETFYDPHYAWRSGENGGHENVHPWDVDSMYKGTSLDCELIKMIEVNEP